MAAADPNPPRAARLLALVVTMLFSALSLNLFNGSLPVYLAREGFSVGSVGLLVGVAFTPQLIATPFVGPLVDRYGARLAIRIGSGLQLVAAALFLTGSAAVAIGTARVLQGLGFALVLPAAYSVVPASVPPRFRGAALGVLGAFPNVALAIGPPIGIRLLQQSPTALFLAAVAAAAVGWLGSWLLGGARPRATRKRFFTYQHRWTPLFAVTFLSVAYFGVVIAYLPLHVPPAQVPAVGWFFSADALGVLAFRIPAGLLTDRYGARWLLLAGIGVTVVAVLLLLLPPSALLLVVAGIGTGAGAALLLPPILVELAKRSDESNRGTAMALYTTSFAAAIGVGSLAAAPVVDHLGFDTALLLSALACLLAVPLALAATRQGR